MVSSVGHRGSRFREGALSGRNCWQWNTGTPYGSGWSAGKPEATKAEIRCGNRMSQEADAAGAKAQRKARPLGTLPLRV